MTLVLFSLLLFAPLQEHEHSAMHKDVDKRGDQVMGFLHEKTTHHFLLHKDGGTIAVSANAAVDTQSRDQIRQHLGHIAKMFAAGDFQAPMLIHAQTPPGVPVMKTAAAKIAYTFEETDRGASVRMRTRDAGAIAAVHEFLRFQISDHRTGDSGKIE